MDLTFRDVRGNERRRTIELGGLVVVTDDNANDFHNASKSAVVSYVQKNLQSDEALAGDADSEVRDTLRLYFRIDAAHIAHLDIPDPHDELFLSTTGPGANVLKDRTDLALDVGGPGEAVDSIITDTLAGEILISDGEQPAEFLYGERVTWR
jgi:hypothetical protein